MTQVAMMSTLTSLNGVVLKPVAGQNIITSTGPLVVPLTIAILPTSTADAFVIQEPAGSNMFRLLDNTGGGAGFSASCVMSGTNGGWNFGTDTTSTVLQYRDFFIGQLNYPANNNVRDTFYIQANSNNPPGTGGNPPGIGMGGGCSQYTDMANYIATIQPWSDSPSGQGGVLIRTGLAQVVGTPALNIVYQNGAGNLFAVYPDGSMVSNDSTNTAIFAAKAGQIWSALRLSVGGGTTVTQSAAVFQIKTASGTSATLNMTTGANNGNLTITATDGSATCSILAVNASDLLLGTNNTTYWTLQGSSAAVKGLLTHAPSLTLSAGPADLTLHTISPVIAGAFTVTRLDYIQLTQYTGAATVTDAAVFSFNAAAGTHKATVGATTKVTVTAVTAWLKVNMNGTILYSPLYASTTA